MGLDRDDRKLWRCPDCGGWRYYYRDCLTCRILTGRAS